MLTIIIVFKLLSEYSQGVATIVHLLTSPMQKSDNNSRIGFELAKQQLKLHISHRKLEKVDNYSVHKQTTSSDTTQRPPTTAKPGKESLGLAKIHPVYQ